MFNDIAVGEQFVNPLLVGSGVIPSVKRGESLEYLLHRGGRRRVAQPLAPSVNILEKMHLSANEDLRLLAEDTTDQRCPRPWCANDEYWCFHNTHLSVY
jgi:hypothetical protein